MYYAKTIAIDGPAGSGKSTIGAKLAAKLGYVFVDAGMLYRTITGAALANHINVYDEKAVSDFAGLLSIEAGTSEMLLNGQPVPFDLHSDAINRDVPVVAAYPGVRACVRQIQQRMAQQEGIVFSGRDIGTVVLPHAELKIFLNPSLEERARRRYTSHSINNPDISPEHVLNDLKHRDWLDTTRSQSPLRIPEDAVVVNTDGMEIEDVLNLLMEYACRE